MEKESQTIFEKNVIEFVTVAAEFCAFLERAEHMKRKAFVDTSLKILPLLYLKASLLPKCETIGDEAPETYVTEEIYEILRMISHHYLVWHQCNNYRFNRPNSLI